METKKEIYFDNAATTPIEPRVFEEMVPYLRDFYGNPSSTHAQGRRVKTVLEQCRRTVAKLLNVTASEIFFTSGGTEADNTALRCFVRDQSVKHIITSKLEHHAVLHTAEDIANTTDVSLHLLGNTDQGVIDYGELEDLLKTLEGKVLVSLMYANNEIGNLLDIQKVSTLCKTYEAIFHSDTVQAIGHYSLDLSKLSIHSIAAAAHKFHGPKGVGFMYLKKGEKVNPLITGGGQERNMRGGTENISGIVGLTKALELAVAEMEETTAHILALKKRMIEGLKAKVSGVMFNGLSGDLDKSLYTVLNVSLPVHEANGMLLFQLDLKGIASSGGSACSSGALLGSHVLQALNTDPERGAIRFSFSKDNTIEEVDYVVDYLSEVYQ